jgi:hypothetical protein
MFLSDEAQQLQRFEAKETCIIEQISREDVFRVARKYYKLADALNWVRQKFEEEEVDFDFFRFKIPRSKPLPEETRRDLRLKFRALISDFTKAVRRGERSLPQPLEILKSYQLKRNEIKEDINAKKF